MFAVKSEKIRILVQLLNVSQTADLAPGGNNSSCKWANIAEDIFGLMELGWLMFLCCQ